jgi:hypothetical protein
MSGIASDQSSSMGGRGQEKGFDIGEYYNYINLG